MVLETETSVLWQEQTCPSLKGGLSLENVDEKELENEPSHADQGYYQCVLENMSCIPSSNISESLLKTVFSMIHLGAYEIFSDELQFEDQIGEGQFGLVYKGAWRGQPCAIKKLKDGISNQSIEYQRLLIELAILAAIGTHPNIVGFSGACIQDLSSPLIVEEFVDGMNLEEYLSRKSLGFNLGRTKTFRWSLDILSALEHLHGLDPAVMHRDLKPANILVTRGQQALKLADFGLATRCHRSNDLAKEKHTCNIGTPRYTAPEVLERLYDGDAATTSAVYTEKADVYSAALVIYYFLTGWQPACDVRRNPRARPDVGSAARRWPQMAALLERMWSHDADARPAATECAAVVRLLPLSRATCVSAPGCSVQ